MTMLGVGAGPERVAVGTVERGSALPTRDREALAILLSVQGLGPLTLARPCAIKAWMRERLSVVILAAK